MYLLLCARCKTTICWLAAGAIIGDGDRKRASFLVLGLAPSWIIEETGL